MKYVIQILCITLLFVSSWALCQEIDKTAIADAELSALLKDWTKNLSPKIRAKRYQHKASMVHWAVHYDLDILLVGRIPCWESSWRPHIRGSRGEYGLMQILNEKLLTKYPAARTDPDTNIRAGCELLRECLDTCPTVKSALGKYGSGHCTEAGSWLDYRYKTYLNDVKKFRIKQGALQS